MLTDREGNRLESAFFDCLLPAPWVNEPKRLRNTTWARCEQCHSVGRARNDRNYVKLRLTNPFYDAQDAFIMDVCNSVSRRWSENAAKRHAFYAFRNLPEAVNPLEAA